jgi:hypothetical protein
MELLIIIVLALILFSVLRFFATPIILTIGIGMIFGPEAAGYAFIPLLILTLIVKPFIPNW